jgi:hypothetical protein
MAYTKTGPFVNGTTPAISATFLNNLEGFFDNEVENSGSLAVQTILAATSDLTMGKVANDNLVVTCSTTTLPSGWGSMDLQFFVYVEVGVDYCDGYRFTTVLKDSSNGFGLTPHALYGKCVSAIPGSAYNFYDSIAYRAQKLGATAGVGTELHVTCASILNENGTLASPVCSNRYVTVLKYRTS